MDKSRYTPEIETIGFPAIEYRPYCWTGHSKKCRTLKDIQLDTGYLAVIRPFSGYLVEYPALDIRYAGYSARPDTKFDIRSDTGCLVHP